MPSDPRHWVNNLRVGDVIESPAGVHRIVRSFHLAHIGPNHVRSSISLVIRRQSWKGRCYTTVNGNDLIQQGYRQVKANVALRKKIDREIQRNIQAKGGLDRQALRARDVAGIP